jgi:dTDP-4-dehydrorhamnose reductase
MNKKLLCIKPEIWGGMECTINRVGDVYRDQLDETGHYIRGDDLDKLSVPGFTKFRYPILWERHFPKEEKQLEWEWTTSQLDILRQKNIEPIAGLIHHGSGPTHTDLLDKDFPVKLAAYAKQVAETFPWINYYTPVNEPLTTARFSGLYGFWYPHKKTDAAFVRMLLNQLKGVVLSMQAIREINPEAILIQTEDLSKTYSTPALAYQAEFENHRRWLTYDFLTGKVNKDHFAWKYFTDNGIAEEELFFFLKNPCPPGIAGFNYYVTSERFLDENLAHYPLHTHGHNQFQAYADTEAVRSGHMKGAATLLTEAWWRYKIPIALTECQLACTREQQMKWFYLHFKNAENLCRQRIPVIAITAWGLLGAVDWNTLISIKNGQYETGVFDISHKYLRPTALVAMIRALGKGKDYYHPALDRKGWWQPAESTVFNSRAPLRAGSGKRLVIIDNNTYVSKIFRNLCKERNLLYTTISIADPEYSSPEQLASIINNCSPWAIVNPFVFTSRSAIARNGFFSQKQLRNKRSLITKKSRIIQLLQITADIATDHSPVTVEKNNARHMKIFFQRLNAANLVSYLEVHLNEMVNTPKTKEIEIEHDILAGAINRALDLLIDSVEGVWLVNQNTENFQMSLDKNNPVLNEEDHAQDTRKQTLKKTIIQQVPVH